MLKSYSSAIVVILMACSACRSETDSHADHPVGGQATSDAASAAVAHVNSAAAPSPAPTGMVWVPGGTF
jgi:hypothetical protein